MVSYMEINRVKGMQSGYDYEFLEDNKVLRIIFGGNLDLYWSLDTNKSYTTYEEAIKELYDTFTITKENYQIYSLFKKLLDDIKNANVYTPMCDTELTEDDELIELPPTYDEILRTKRLNEELKRREAYQRINDGEAITWHSDEEPYDIADVLRMSEVDDCIILEFLRPELTGEKMGIRSPSSISIRFRNSGSYYNPFNIAFMNMYRELQKFDPEYDREFHQIHIEELQHTLKRSSI